MVEKKNYKSKMLNKDYRDVRAALEVLLNRQQQELAKNFTEMCIENKVISRKEAKQMLLERKKSWPGAFWFFLRSKCNGVCHRCENKFEINKPICLTFKNEPFCINCLTRYEKENPNPNYRTYIENLSEPITNENTTVPDTLTNLLTSSDDIVISFQEENDLSYHLRSKEG